MAAYIRVKNLKQSNLIIETPGRTVRFHKVGFECEAPLCPEILDHVKNGVLKVTDWLGNEPAVESKPVEVKAEVVEVESSEPAPESKPVEKSPEEVRKAVENAIKGTVKKPAALKVTPANEK